MTSLINTTTTRFREYREAFLSSGGKPKAIKYPKDLQQLAVACCKQYENLTVGKIAVHLEVSVSALHKWCNNDASNKKENRVNFVPVAVITPPPPAVAQIPEILGSRGNSIRVAWRGFVVDFGEIVDPRIVANVMVAVNTAETASC